MRIAGWCCGRNSPIVADRFRSSVHRRARRHTFQSPCSSKIDRRKPRQCLRCCRNLEWRDARRCSLRWVRHRDWGGLRVKWYTSFQSVGRIERTQGSRRPRGGGGGRQTLSGSVFRVPDSVGSDKQKEKERKKGRRVSTKVLKRVAKGR